MSGHEAPKKPLILPISALAYSWTLSTGASGVGSAGIRPPRDARPVTSLPAGVETDRRRAPRRPLTVGVEVYGYDGDLTLVHAFGTTANVSRTGLFATVDERLPVGTKAVVSVRPAHPSLLPRLLRGRVVRCRGRGDGFGLAIQFDPDISRAAAPHVEALPH